ncbi:MAG: CapA family protein [Gammaproteobacteria bacterium]|nr:CapA family protein [Gammaproteobacteria bacterium]
MKLINIKAVGDIATGDYTVGGIGIGSVIKKFGSDFPFKKLNNVLDGSDILIGNLEGPLTSRAHTEDMRLCGIPELAKSLKAIGFDVLSIANNHAFDYGADVFKETVSICEEAGLQLCGQRDYGDFYCKPVIHENDGFRIGILAYNWVGLERNAGSDKYIANIYDGIVNYTWNRDPLVDKKSQNEIDRKNVHVINDIKRLNQLVDAVVVLPHWGYEWGIYPPYGVVLEAQSFVEAGASAVIGSHPHVIQGVQQYKTGVIAYSLGNFLFDAPSDKFNTGMILDCKILSDKRPEISYHFVKRSKYFQPVPVSGDAAQSSMTMVSKSSKAIISDDVSVFLDDEKIYKEYENQYNYLKRQKVIFLFKAMIRNPKLIVPILGKIKNLMLIIIMRLQGKRVRW